MLETPLCGQWNHHFGWSNPTFFAPNMGFNGCSPIFDPSPLSVGGITPWPHGPMPCLSEVQQLLFALGLARLGLRVSADCPKPGLSILFECLYVSFLSNTFQFKKILVYYSVINSIVAYTCHMVLHTMCDVYTIPRFSPFRELLPRVAGLRRGLHCRLGQLLLNLGRKLVVEQFTIVNKLYIHTRIYIYKHI